VDRDLAACGRNGDGFDWILSGDNSARARLHLPKEFAELDVGEHEHTLPFRTPLEARPVKIKVEHQHC
jgi:hypothetical protein